MGITDGAKAVAGKAVAGGKGIAVGYWRGLTYPFRGARLVYVEHPKLIKIWIFPILITLLLLGLLGWGGWAAHQPITDAIWAEQQVAPVEASKVPRVYDKHKGKPHKPRMKPPPSSSGWLTSAGRTALSWVVLLGLWGIGLLLVVFLSSVVAAPFNDLLSEEVEHLAAGIRGPPFTWKVLVRDSVRTLGLEAVKWTIYGLVMGLLFVLSFFVPAIGQVISSIVGFLFTTLYFAIDYVDWPASRRNRSVTYRFGMVTEHFMPMFGFGTGVWMFLFLPLVNLLFMPAVVAGGTLLFLDLEGQAARQEPDAAAV